MYPSLVGNDVLNAAVTEKTVEFCLKRSAMLSHIPHHSGNESLKKMQQLISLEEVEKLMDETADAAEYQRQISDLLSGGLSDADESEVSCLRCSNTPTNKTGCMV